MSRDAVSSDELRAMIREALAELLPASTSRPNDRPEEVRIESDADLARFVARLIERLDDPVQGAALRSGQARFALVRPAVFGGTARVALHTQTSTPGAKSETAAMTGVITERRLRGIARGSRLSVASGTTITPLARDLARSLCITFDWRHG
jgi:hypothetical protein